MRKSRCAEEQIVAMLKESEAGLETAGLRRMHGISNPIRGSQRVSSGAAAGIICS